MPLLNIDELMSDPDFMDTVWLIARNGTVNQNGVYVITQQAPFPFQAMVVPMSAHDLGRFPDMSRTDGNISLITATELSTGSSTSTPDLVQWNDQVYICSRQDDFSNYGAGFNVVHCQKQALVDALVQQ